MRRCYATEHLKWIFSKKKLHTNAARISRHLQPSSLRRRHRKNRGYDGVGGFAVTFCILGNIWKKQVAKMVRYGAKNLAMEEEYNVKISNEDVIEIPAAPIH